MNKFTSLCFSLVVAGCLPVCADAAVATGQTADTSKEKSEAGVVSRRMLDRRVRAVSNGSIAPAKSVIKRSESTATLTTDKLYGNRCMPDPTGWGKVKGDGTVDIDIEIETNSSNGEKVTVAGVTQEKTYLFVVQSSPFGVLGSYIFTYNNATHERTGKTWIEWEDYPQGGVFNPADNCVYGFAINGRIKYNCETNEITNLAAVDVEKTFNPQVTLAGDAIIGIDGATGNVYEYSMADGFSTMPATCS